MEKYEHVSIWKDTSFWDTVHGYFYAVFSLLVIIFVFLESALYDLFIAVYLIFSFISVLFGRISENTSAKGIEIKQVLLYRTLLYVIVAVSFFVPLNFLSNTRDFVILYSITWITVFFVFGVMLKERLVQKWVFRYLFNDGPSLLSKRFYEENKKSTIIATIVVYSIFIAIVVLFILSLVFNWD